ncbi:unnamed protein product [Rhizophagus irregularis]|nr:unnamed protein product [Rhizophagus irregularis]
MGEVEIGNENYKVTKLNRFSADFSHEPEDPKPKIVEECGETSACKPLKHHLEECTRRVEESGTGENCAEEFLHFMHCVDHCAAPKIFAC